MNDRARHIQQIRELPAQLREKVAGLNAEQLTTHYVEGEWTIAQNVHHLADTHMICIRRFKLILTNPTFDYVAYDVNLLAGYPDADNPNIEDSLNILTGLHARWAILMENLTEEEWQKKGNHPRRDDYSLEYLAGSYAKHGRDHLQQIQDVLDAMAAATS